MPIENLDTEQSFAFIAETNSAASLLAYGVRVVRTARFIDTTRDPIMTMLSIGLEKLYKLTVGLLSLDTRGRWPTKAEMKGYGHDLETLHESVMGAIRDRSRARSQYVRDWVGSVDDDLCVPPLITALGEYGTRSRFYYLDRLAESPQLRDPRHAWEEVLSTALKDPVVAEMYARATADVRNGDLWDELGVAQNRRVAQSIERLWTMIAVAGRNYCLGPTGAVFGFEVHPSAVGSQ